MTFLPQFCQKRANFTVIFDEIKTLWRAGLPNFQSFLFYHAVAHNIMIVWSGNFCTSTVLRVELPLKILGKLEFILQHSNCLFFKQQQWQVFEKQVKISTCVRLTIRLADFRVNERIEYNPKIKFLTKSGGSPFPNTKNVRLFFRWLPGLSVPNNLIFWVEP